MNKPIEQLINELDIKDPEYTTLYELFTEAGITGVRWFKVAAFIQKKLKMSSYFNKIKKDPAWEFYIMALAQGYDAGFRDGTKAAKK